MLSADPSEITISAVAESLVKLIVAFGHEVKKRSLIDWVIGILNSSSAIFIWPSAQVTSCSETAANTSGGIGGVQAEIINERTETVNKELAGYLCFLIFLSTLQKHKGGRVRCAAPVHDLVIAYLVLIFAACAFATFKIFPPSGTYPAFAASFGPHESNR